VTDLSAPDASHQMLLKQPYGMCLESLGKSPELERSLS